MFPRGISGLLPTRLFSSGVFNLALVAGVGIVSGKYIFKAPLEEFLASEEGQAMLREYHQKKQQQEQQKQVATASGNSKQQGEDQATS